MFPPQGAPPRSPAPSVTLLPFGLDHPGGRLLLSTKVAPPVQSPASSARCGRGLAHAPGGIAPMSLIPASYSLAVAPGDPQSAGPTVVRTDLRAARFLLWARQPAPLRRRAASTVFNAPTGAPAARPQAVPSTTQGSARSAANSRPQLHGA
ncbi:hypothetical protein NDU88_000657 [Pleurodeles waltl]|uniref:Uncharacterized protein n=1 Tax=Pleurodeles waltl TaxID=8319 RepID=A0AAV7SXX0_PLEWA|nr:hypothetical protein NDU88_000657 [Pleurodeles waltl]